MSAPAIGIGAMLERASWDVWQEEAVALAPCGYALAVQRAGGLALLLVPDEAATADPDRLLERIDGLLLAGGADLDPGSYGAAPRPGAGAARPARDRFELALTRRAIERRMPLLGVCRGMQLLNVALGGSLVQHLPEVVGHEGHRSVPGTFDEHGVRLGPGTLARRAAGAERIAVKSHHHQGVDRLGEGLEVSGRSEDDEVVEAIELPGQRFCLGVIWHPEEEARSAVIDAFVEAARAAAGERREREGSAA